MSYDPAQPGWGTPPAPNAGFQPPEGTNPGNIPPQPQPPAGGWTPDPNAGYAAQGYAPQRPYYETYPGPMAASTSGWAIASLVLSIAAYVGLVGIGGLLGAIFGHLALNEINRSNGQLQGRGMAIAGMILGYVNIGLTLCTIAAFIALGFGILGSLH